MELSSGRLGRAMLRRKGGRGRIDRRVREGRGSDRGRLSSTEIVTTVSMDSARGLRSLVMRVEGKRYCQVGRPTDLEPHSSTGGKV